MYLTDIIQNMSSRSYYVYDLTFYWEVEGIHPLSTELHEGRLPSQWAQFQITYEPLTV